MLRYGNMRDLVLGIEAVLPDGRIYSALRGLRKDNTGYDLKQLFIGSEGTLGIITAAVLKLMPLPRSTAVALVAVESPAAAVSLLTHAKQVAGPHVTAFELVSAPALTLVLDYLGGMTPPLEGHPEWMVLVELTSGGEQEGLEASLMQILEAGMERRLGQRCGRRGQRGGRPALLAHPRGDLRRADPHRRQHQVRRVGAAFDACRGSSRRHRARCWRSRRERAWWSTDTWATATCTSIPCGPRTRMPGISSRSTMTRFRTRVDGLAHSLGGSISAEHGIGVAKRDDLRTYKSDVELDADVAGEAGIGSAQPAESVEGVAAATTCGYLRGIASRLWAAPCKPSKTQWRHAPGSLSVCGRVPAG